MGLLKFEGLSNLAINLYSYTAKGPIPALLISKTAYEEAINLLILINDNSNH